MRQVEIDIDVHRAIEAERQNFQESDNAILRRLLRIDRSIPGVASPRPRLPRSSGAYSVVIENRPLEGNSLKELLGAVLGHLRDTHGGSMARIAASPRRGGRHVVATSPEALYPRSPHLVEFAVPLDDQWWFDGNVSRAQVGSILVELSRMFHWPSIPRITKREHKAPAAARS